MTRQADRIHTDPAAIARLEALIAALPNGARVRLQLDDESELSGIVAARPVLQVFYDAAGTEGSNAVLRLEIPADAEGGDAAVRDLWLDRVVGIRDLEPS